MLRELVAEAITALNEREFEHPFRQLLRAMDFQCLRGFTVHGPYEFGKDIVAVKPRPRTEGFDLFAFQTKVGNITQSRWSEMERQTQEMVLSQVRHPNLSGQEPIKPVWVCTGELDSKVEQLLFDANQRFQGLGLPTVEVWGLENLTTKFVRHFFSVELFPHDVRDSVHRLLLSFEGNQYDSSSLTELLRRESAQPPLERLPSFLILGYYLVGRARQVKDPWSAAEALEQLAVWSWGVLVANQQFAAEWLERIDALSETLVDLLSEACTDLNFSEPSLMRWPPSISEVVAYPIRAMEVTSWVAFLFLVHKLKGNEKDANLWAERLLQLVGKNRNVLAKPISDLQSGQLFLIGLALLLIPANDEASTLFQSALSWMERIWRDGAGLARAGAADTEVVRRVFGYPFERVPLERAPASELLGTTLGLLGFAGERTISWNVLDLFDSTSLSEIIPSSEKGAFSIDSEDRKDYTRTVLRNLPELADKLLGAVEAQRKWECVKRGYTHILLLANRCMRYHAWWLLRSEAKAPTAQS